MCVSVFVCISDVLFIIVLDNRYVCVLDVGKC